MVEATAGGQANTINADRMPRSLCRQIMDNDSIDQKIDLVAEKYNELIGSHNRVCDGIGLITQVLSDLDLRQSAVEDHVGTTLVVSINEIKEELLRLSTRLDAIEEKLTRALDCENSGVPTSRS
jgi:tetrahydromethanopterin S-methyltransferase subunit G